MSIEELTIGTVCGGSDGTSGLTANPAVGRAFDALVGAGATCIFEETLEMVGCEEDLAQRAVTPALAVELRESVAKAERYSVAMGYPSFAAGNATGGLTTIEEKSLGAYSKSGRGQVHGLIKPGDIPERGGLFLLDVVPDGDSRWGFPNINDSVEIAELDLEVRRAGLRSCAVDGQAQTGRPLHRAVRENHRIPSGFAALPALVQMKRGLRNLHVVRQVIGLPVGIVQGHRSAHSIGCGPGAGRSGADE